MIAFINGVKFLVLFIELSHSEFISLNEIII